MKLGIDILLTKHQKFLKQKRIGILAHAASMNVESKHTIDHILSEYGPQVKALFGPEHGLFTKAEDMVPVSSTSHPAFGIPVYSLYGSTLDSLKPTKEMLQDIDVLIIDLQDIGARYYTYVWTACLCVEACAELGKSVIVCDRPNPIGGLKIEGREIEPGFESFVGLYSLPVRHGMTIGEIVKFVNDCATAKADLSIIKMEGWKREMSFADTKLPWVNPSPNMRSYNAAILYPGMCLLEATNFSEGRGTDTPFEIVGAPYIDTDELIAEFKKMKIKGVHVAPTSFIPVRQKWAGKLCHGIRWVVTDVSKFDSYFTGLVFTQLAYRLYKDRGFEWRTAPYEFVTTRAAIDLLTGSAVFREGIKTLSKDELKKLAQPSKKMQKERNKALLY